MQKNRCLWLLLAFIICLGHAPIGKAAGPVEKAHSSSTITAYELYSWHEGNIWYFSLLPGKNADKLEIEESKVPSVHAIKASLKALAPGTEVYWNKEAPENLDLSLPPESVRAKVIEACRQHHLKLIK